MELTDITNYDVLVELPSPGLQSGDYQLAKHKNHVGNNRLCVFLNLYQQAYDGASCRVDFNECDRIVDKILDTVCHQCFPRGRFLVSLTSQNGAGVALWTNMQEQTAKTLLHKVLQPTTEAKNKTESGKKGDEGLKRRRQSSLLKCSASEGMVAMDPDDKKKLTRMDEAETDSNIIRNPAQSIISSEIMILNRMDVILATTQDALDPISQSVGNNRLHILMAMQKGQYQLASPSCREKNINEIIQTVKIFWRGRFLVEGAFGYEEVGEDQAKLALKEIFGVRSQIPLQLPLMQRHHSQPVLVNSSIPQRTTLSKQASLTMIQSGAGGVAHVSGLKDMRSAAVKSLQRKKERQSSANRLEKIAILHASSRT
jgi:hypothetical protein